MHRLVSEVLFLFLLVTLAAFASFLVLLWWDHLIVIFTLRIGIYTELVTVCRI